MNMHSHDAVSNSSWRLYERAFWARIICRKFAANSEAATTPAARPNSLRPSRNTITEDAIANIADGRRSSSSTGAWPAAASTPSQARSDR